MEKRYTGRVEIDIRSIDEASIHRPLIDACARSETGSGWQVPLKDMSPNDLRYLANLMESKGIKSGQTLGEKHQEMFGE